MDAFFASVEQRDHPELRGKPVVVGGDSKRSVVAAASYEARKYGVFSALPMALAKQKCPDLIIVPHRFSVYRDISRQIRAIFNQYTDLVEPLSLDEAYLDVTSNKMNMLSATLIAKEIKARVWKETRLSCTAGVSINKFLAKVASGLNKPDGLTVITPKKVPGFLDQLSIDKFYGVGKVTEQKMKALGISTGADLKKVSMEELIRRFGKAGKYYYDVCRGIDDREVSPSRIRKSISVERTFEENIYDEEQIKTVLERLCRELHENLERLNQEGRTLHLKWRYPDFTTPTRSHSFQQFTRDYSVIVATLTQLFVENVELVKGIRLLGIGISNLNNRGQLPQLTLDI